MGLGVAGRHVGIFRGVSAPRARGALQKPESLESLRYFSRHTGGRKMSPLNPAETL